MKDFCSKVLSCGAYLPKTCRTNTDLEQNLDTSHDWIVQRTGIHQRYIAQDQTETTAYMGYQAAKDALENANLLPHDVDMIILA
ncbi:MAG: 3-oxoacyl-ACP synthase, partial [Alphaproteobacteria bacterium]|nr:3-oxoacyl-ACP synthase [Alphaproteobacteria bacterium]